jgi:hypothetical protein
MGVVVPDRDRSRSLDDAADEQQRAQGHPANAGKTCSAFT